MTTKEVLSAAKALIDTPKKWCKDEYDTPTGARSTLAALHLVKLNHYVHINDLHDAIHALASVSPNGRISYNYDSSTTHADVMAWFDRAIENAS